MAELEPVRPDDPDPSSPQRLWLGGRRLLQRWHNPLRTSLLVAFLAMISIGGYVCVHPRSPHPATPGPTPSASSLEDALPPGLLPPGAQACPRIQTIVKKPFNAGARGTPTTSCGFVEQVRREYSAHTTPAAGPMELSTISPATYKWYTLACFDGGDYATCTGGAAAVIYLYNRPGIN